MNNLKTLLFLLLSAMTSAVYAQELLPKPKQATFGKGYFKNGVVKTYRMTSNDGGKIKVESYRLHITKDSLIVAYADSAGLFYAQQTIEQLKRNNKIPICDIYDYPSHPWRGCMIDVSRHFFPITFLKKQVDILSHYKINRLHLHLTDAGGWRMQIDRYPLLTSQAAWRTESDWTKWWIDNDRRYMKEGESGAYGGYYTKDELRQLVAYAAKRGITVVPEIEMPGHSEEVTAAYPALKCEGNTGAQGDVCPSNEATYTFYHNVLNEVMDVFPSHWIHIGGDEAGKEHWAKCPRCIKKAKMLGLRSTRDLQGWLIQRMAAYLRLCGREVIGWDEVLDDSLVSYAPSLGDNVNIMVWRDQVAVNKALKRGHNVILTPGEYYLDRYQDAPPSLPYANGGYMPLSEIWDRVAPADNIFGVQGNMWAEYISTPSYAEFMLYPRMLAIAEVGWSGRNRSYQSLCKAIISQYSWLNKHNVNAFDLRKEAGERRSKSHITKHIALGAKVIYNAPWSKQYPGKGKTTLTDGFGGGWAYGDGSWQGFMQGNDTTSMPLDVTIDLGSIKKLSAVSIDFMRSQGAWVYFPQKLLVSTSTDAKSFSPVFEKEYPNVSDPTYSIGTFRIPCSVRTRFIKVQARVFQPGQWLFTDEIKVLK